MYHPSCPVNIFYFYINLYFFLVIFRICILVCFLPRNIYMCRKRQVYPVNRFGANKLRKIAKVPFHSIWGLCWYNFFGFLKSKSRKVSFLKVKWNAATLDMFCFWVLESLHVVLPFTIGFWNSDLWQSWIMLLRIEAGTDVLRHFGVADWTR